MNLLDGIFLIIIVASSLYGVFKGLIKEVISILAIIVGLIVSSRLYDKASPLVTARGVNEQVSAILSFFLLFVIVFIALILLGKLLHKLVHASFLGWLNRLGGVGFGLIRGIAVSGIIIIILTVTLSEKTPILAQSKLTPPIMRISKVLLSLVPEEVQGRFMEQERKLREFWDRKLKP